MWIFSTQIDVSTVLPVSMLDDKLHHESAVNSYGLKFRLYEVASPTSFKIFTNIIIEIILCPILHFIFH